MEISITVFNQIIIMFLLMSVGFFAEKFGFFSKQTTKDLNNFVMIVVMSSNIINSFNIDFNKTQAINLFYALILSFTVHFIGIFIANICFKGEKHENLVSKIGVVYSNCGFMALPLLLSAFGTDGVFYGSVYIAVFNIFVWCHAVNIFENPKKITEILKTCLKKPVIVSVFLGISIYLLQIPIPYQIGSVIGYVASLNTPLAMMLLGIFVTRCDFKSSLKSLKMYFVCFLRLVLIPIITIFILKLVSLVVAIDPILALTITVSSACPSAGTTAMMCEKFDLDTSFGISIITFSTLFSCVTIPILILISQYILKVAL